MDELSRCAHCGEVIGVYEPLVVIEDSRVRRTSYAAEPHLADRHGPRYHHACYTAGQAGDGGREDTV